jgi:hypothetical protein
LPFEVDPVPAVPQQTPPADGSDDVAPLEAEPVDDPDGRLPLAAPDSPDAVNPEDVPVPPSEVAPPVVPAPPVAPAPPTAPPVDDPGAETGVSQPAPPAANPERPRRATKRARKDGGRAKRKARRETTRRGSPRSDYPPAGSPPAASAPATSAPHTPAPAASVPAANAAEPGEAAIVEASVPSDLGNRRFHIVRPGESLWSIAEQLLGRRASAASIALEVRRLWRLNRHRIGTGDPDLLVVGVRLRLR